VQIYDNSTLDISLGDTTTIGSLDGEGTVFLGSNTLVIGGNRNSLFSGIIQNGGGIIIGDGGGVIKTGLRRLVFRRANLYDGGTVVSGGELVVNNKTGSGTGTGSVNVTAGTLTGGGTIAGLVMIGSGSGSGASLAPGRRRASVGALTIQSALTFNSDGTYRYSINSSTGFADEVIANGVTIGAGAQFAAIDGAGRTRDRRLRANPRWVRGRCSVVDGQVHSHRDRPGGSGAGHDLKLGLIPPCRLRLKRQREHSIVRA
jgi:autotransporter-associated beta strand protein